MINSYAHINRFINNINYYNIITCRNVTTRAPNNVQAGFSSRC